MCDRYFQTTTGCYNDVYKSFFDSVYDRIRVALHLVCRYFRLLCSVSLLLSFNF